jgi:plasmid stabilization system protein ParE
VIWLRSAIADLERLVAFASASQARRAPFLADRLASATASLADFPRAGRPVDRTGKRRKLVVRVLADTYVIRYVIEGDTVLIVRA